jgi:hypothetical protein
MIADGVAAAARRAILAAFSFQLSAISYQPLPASPSAISFQLSAFSRFRLRRQLSAFGFQLLPASPSAFCLPPSASGYGHTSPFAFFALRFVRRSTGT